MIPLAIQNQINNQHRNLPLDSLAQTTLFCYYTSLADNLVFSQENLDELLSEDIVSAFYAIPLLPDLISGYAEHQTGDAIFKGTLMSSNSTTEQNGQILVENPLLRFVVSQKLTLASHINIPEDKAIRFFRLEKPPTTKLDDLGNVVELTEAEIIEYEKTVQKTFYAFSKTVVLKPPTTLGKREVAYYIYTFNEFSRQIKKNWNVSLLATKTTKTVGGLPNQEITDQILNENKGVVKIRLRTTKPMLLNNIKIKGSADRQSTTNFQQIPVERLTFNSQTVNNTTNTTSTKWRVLKLNPTLISGGTDIQWECQQATEYNNFYKNVVNTDLGITNFDKDPRNNYLISGANKNSTLNNGKSIFNAFETDNGVDTIYNSKTAIVGVVSRLLHHSFNEEYQGGKWANGLGLLEKAYQNSGDLSSLRILNSIFNFDLLTSATIGEMENPEQWHCGAPVHLFLLDQPEIRDAYGKVVYDSVSLILEKGEYYCEFNPDDVVRKYGINRATDDRYANAPEGALYMHSKTTTLDLYDKTKAMFNLNWLAFYKRKQSANIVLFAQFREQIGLMISGLIFNQYFASGEMLYDFINGDFTYNNQPFQDFPKTSETQGITNTVGSNIIGRFESVDTVASPSNYLCLMEVEEENLPWISRTEASFGDRPSINVLSPKPMELVAFSKAYQSLDNPPRIEDIYTFASGGYTAQNIFSGDALDRGLRLELICHAERRGAIHDFEFNIEVNTRPISLDQLITFPPLDNNGSPNYNVAGTYYQKRTADGTTTRSSRQVRVVGILINGRRHTISSSRQPTWNDAIGTSFGTRYYYREYSLRLRDLITHSQREIQSNNLFTDVSQLIYRGLWGMNQYLGLGGSSTYGDETKIGVIREEYFERNKAQEIEVILPTHNTSYGSITSNNDGYAISEINLGVFCRGDITLEYLDSNDTVVKTQLIAGQRAGTQNAKLLSHTLIG